MRSRINQSIFQLKSIIPRQIRSVLRSMGLVGQRYPLRKLSTLELKYQQSLLKAVRDHQSKLRRYWIQYRYLNDIISICKIDDNLKILDVGCGIATVLHFLKGNRHGIDPLAKEYNRLYCFPEGIDVIEGAGEKIPFPDIHFDFIISSTALDHTIDPLKTINEIWRVLKPDGFFVLVVDVFTEGEVSEHSLHSLKKKDVYSMVADKFSTVFERDAQRMTIDDYINGFQKNVCQELIMVLKKS